jgi:chromosomal replication initiation ATPase DnaA
MSFNPITNKKKNENICVYLRIRPLNNKEKKKREKYAIYVTPEGLRINAEEIVGDVSNIVEKHKDSKFVYDKLFAPETTTDFIFGDYLENVVASTLKGFNSTVFVYGQTGSGKTHTLMGQYKDYINTAEETLKNNDENPLNPNGNC